jgi:hypothetical protein
MGIINVPVSGGTSDQNRILYQGATAIATVANARKLAGTNVTLTPFAPTANAGSALWVGALAAYDRLLIIATGIGPAGGTVLKISPDNSDTNCYSQYLLYTTTVTFAATVTADILSTGAAPGDTIVECFKTPTKWIYTFSSKKERAFPTFKHGGGEFPLGTDLYIVGTDANAFQANVSKIQVYGTASL